MKIIAGIILYNPQIDRLRENIEAICNQLEVVVIVDNGSTNQSEIKELLKQYQNIHYMNNLENVGIAKALNQIMEYAEKDEVDWVLTLDQDSVVPPNLMKEYSAVLEVSNLALVTPNIIDRNFSSKEETQCGIEEVERCITSAGLTNVSVWRTVGGFEEKLFIDYVDFEYCAKVKRNGYKIIKLNDVKLLHEIGNAKVKHILGKNFIVYNHNPVRKYYYFRNVIYCMKKYPDFFEYKQEKRNLRVMFLKSVIFEKSRGKKFIFIIKGIMDGKRMIKENQ